MPNQIRTIALGKALFAFLFMGICFTRTVHAATSIEVCNSGDSDFRVYVAFEPQFGFTSYWEFLGSLRIDAGMCDRVDYYGSDFGHFLGFEVWRYDHWIPTVVEISSPGDSIYPSGITLCGGFDDFSGRIEGDEIDSEYDFEKRMWRVNREKAAAICKDSNLGVLEYSIEVRSYCSLGQECQANYGLNIDLD